MDEPKSQFIYIKHEVRPRNISGRSQVAMGFILGTLLGGAHGFLMWANLPWQRSRRSTILLNHIAKYGRTTGRAGGILTLMYAGFGTALSKYRGVDDEANTVLSSTASGYLYSCTKGFHQMVISGALGLTVGMGVAIHNSEGDLIQHWTNLTADFVKGKTFNSNSEETENNY